MCLPGKAYFVAVVVSAVVTLLTSTVGTFCYAGEDGPFLVDQWIEWRKADSNTAPLITTNEDDDHNIPWTWTTGNTQNWSYSIDFSVGFQAYAVLKFGSITGGSDSEAFSLGGNVPPLEPDEVDGCAFNADKAYGALYCETMYKYRKEQYWIDDITFYVSRAETVCETWRSSKMKIEKLQTYRSLDFCHGDNDFLSDTTPYIKDMASQANNRSRGSR